MTTERLYWKDPYLETFETERCRVATIGDAPSLVFDATAFYPEAGGQLGDRGLVVAIDDASIALPVVDTQIDEAGVIHHVLAAPPAARELDAFARGVRGVIDGARRASQRAQHTAQHMLSCALVTEAAAPTASARLGTTSSTIDVSREKLDDGALARAEDLVNAVVRANRPVTAFFPDPVALAALPLRRPPKVTSDVRVVAVGDEGAWFDVTPCGGTHVARSGEIGAVRVVSVERYKGMLRVTFLAGAEALADARAKHEVLAALGRDLSCGALDVPSALAKLRADLKSERDAAAKLRAELADAVAASLLARAEPSDVSATPVVVVREGADVSFLRALAGRLTERADVIAVVASLSPDGAGTALVVQRGARAGLDCGAFFKALIAASGGGRGGGSPARAEGRVDASLTREFLETQLRVAEAGRA